MKPVSGSALRFPLVLGVLISVLLALLVRDAGAQAPPGWTATPLQPVGVTENDKEEPPQESVIGPQPALIVIIKLDEQPLASYDGSIPGLAATSPAITGADRLDVNSPASQAYLAYLQQRHADFTAQLTASVPGATVLSDLTVVVGGVIASIPFDSSKAVQRLPNVELVIVDELRQLNTDASPEFIGATAIWEDLGGQDSAGEGVVVGVLDTGVWPEHPSYADPDPAGNAYPPPPVAPAGASCQFGSAVPGDAPFACNNKLILARRFMATYQAVLPLLPGEFLSARDDNGHGTHTSTTAAGNGEVQASIFGLDRGVISGIAPRAHVAAYKVCGDQGCFQSDSVAAIQQAVIDGVDVINFSISGGNEPYADAVELAFLDAYNAGVFVSASAGNAGPGLDTTSHRGPWVTTVAASTSDRHFVSDLSVTAGNGDTLALQGSSVTHGLPTPAPVVLPPAGNEACVLPFAPNSLDGQIVVCRRLAGARILKSFEAGNAGAVGMILLNEFQDSQGLDEFTDNHYIPTVHLGFHEAQTLRAFLSSHTGVTASFTESVPAEVQGDRITGFSSRGGPGQSGGVSKPDVTAPGLQILAGNSAQGATALSGPDGELFQAIAGTSMSSPHVAGSAALLVDLHPDWTPGQVKSALMTSANRDVVSTDGDTPASHFETGSGRVDLSVAGDPGITFDATGADYVTHRTDLWNANYPSIYVPVLGGQVTIERTALSVDDQTRAWNITARDVPSDVTITTSPNVLQLGPGEEETFTITIDARNVPLGETREARIELKHGNDVASIPVTFVRRTPAVTLSKVCEPATIFRTGNQQPTTTTCTITATNNAFDDATATIVDNVPKAVRVDAASVTGATSVDGNLITWEGVIPGAEPPDVTIAPGPSIAGYLPLSLFGVPPVPGMGDETIVNFNVPPFSFAGETYTQLAVDSNGYVVVGGGSGGDNSFNNQSLPSPARPNNVLAPFWTDLNPGAGGAVRISTLTDGVDTWIVVDFDAVREFSSAANTHSFQIWIGINGDANPGEDISYAFGPNTGNGDGGFLTVGAENRFGNRGAMTYFNGAGALPVNGTELRVTTTPPAPGGQHVITFEADAQSRADVVNFAELTADTIAGSVIASAPINVR